MREASRQPRRRPYLLLVTALALIAPAAAQGPAVRFEARFDELTRLADAPAQVATVKHLVIRRDAAEFILEDGQLYRLGPIGGRHVALAFKGTGSFSYSPSSGLEQRRLNRVYKSPALASPINAIVFLFSDSTDESVGRAVTFGPAGADVPGDLRGRVREMVEYASDADSKSPDPDLMGDLLNARTSDLFYAHVVRAGGDPVMFMLDPYTVEGSRLSGRARRAGWTRMTQVVSQSRRMNDSSVATSERWAQAEVTHYTLDVSIPRNAAGEVRFIAAAKLDLTASTPVGPWVAFYLFPKLQIDSARWADGTPAIATKMKDASELWLRLDKALAPGDQRTVTLYYHGDLIARYDDLLYIKSSIAWYPLSLEGRTKATFDLTFHTPPSYGFATVGERTDSAIGADRLVQTHWVSDGPIRNASFNLGVFETYTARADSLPPVTVLYSEQAHRSGLFPRAFAKADVGQDVLNALRFFQHVFGDVPVKQFYVTEIPDDHGEAFPGLIHLALSTFVSTEDNGFDEFFRAHEVAHQWWGIGIDYATYHDRWMSEGFASFSGLWYLQTARKQNKQYFAMLDQWRNDILLHRNADESVAYGDRVGDASAEPSAYQIAVYEKGAWVLHMLRVLMLDFKTMNEDRFTATMREFYGTYRGKRASTDDFRRVVEKHVGTDMRWFFDEWLAGASIPTYKVAWTAEPADGGKFRVKLRVVQENVPADFQMYVPVTVDLGAAAVLRTRVKVRGPLTEVELPLVPSKPKDVHFNDLSGVLAEVKNVGWAN